MKRAASRSAPEWRHESTRRPLRWIAAAFAIIAALLGAAHFGLTVWLHAHAGGPPPAEVAPPPVLPALPGVAPGPPAYRWVDRGAGVAEIPIERAMRLLAVDAGADGDGNGGAQERAP